MTNDEALKIAKKLGWSPPHDAEERERRIKYLESALNEACDILAQCHLAQCDEVDVSDIERLRKFAAGVEP